MVLRLELYTSGLRIITPENQNFYNLTFTLHGLIMIFFTVMPGLYGGFGNYLIPIYNGAPEVAFPRINSVSLLLLPISFGCVLLSTTAEFGGGSGWTLYPPLSTSLMSLSPVSMDVIVLGLALAGISSFLSSLNFLTTIFHIRAKGFALGSIVFNTWGIVFTALMLIFHSTSTNSWSSYANHRFTLKYTILRSSLLRRSSPISAPLLVLRTPRGLRTYYPRLRNYQPGYLH